MKFKHEWTPELLTQAVDAWDRLIKAVTLMRGANALTVDESWGGRRLNSVLCEGDRSHLTELVLADGEATEDRQAMTLCLIGYAYTYGSDLDAANVRYLDENKITGVNIGGGREQDETRAWVQVGEIWTGDDQDPDPTTGIEAVTWLAEMMETLHQHALFSDETHSDYVRELAEQAWDACLWADLSRELEGLLISDDDDAVDLADLPRVGDHVTVDVEQAVRATYYAFVEAAPFVGSGDGWHCPVATEAEVPRATHEQAVKHVVAEVFGR